MNVGVFFQGACLGAEEGRTIQNYKHCEPISTEMQIIRTMEFVPLLRERHPHYSLRP